MSDHFDTTLERKLESNADGAGDGVSNVRRIELITGTGRRRQWSDDDKARIIVASSAPGANVSEVARRNGLSPQQLFAWRREARALFRGGSDAAVTATAEIDDEAPAFVPVVMAHRDLPRSAIQEPAPSSPPPGSPPSPAHSATIEITLGDAVVRVSGPVETSTLIAVLRAVRRSS